MVVNEVKANHYALEVMQYYQARNNSISSMVYAIEGMK